MISRCIGISNGRDEQSVNGLIKRGIVGQPAEVFFATRFGEILETSSIEGRRRVEIHYSSKFISKDPIGSTKFASSRNSRERQPIGATDGLIIAKRVNNVMY